MKLTFTVDRLVEIFFDSLIKDAPLFRPEMVKGTASDAEIVRSFTLWFEGWCEASGVENNPPLSDIMTVVQAKYHSQFSKN